MKKTIALFALVLCILAGLVSGSLALYTKDIDIADTGSVIAKKFYLDAEGTLGYEDNVLIAPEDTVTAAFTVSNHDGAGYVTEVDMDLDVTVTIANADGKTAIPYITARLLDGADVEVGTALVDMTNGVGTITLHVDDAFTAAAGAATLTYQIELTWADLGQNDVGDARNDDIFYQGPNFGNKYSVTVTGTQAV